MISFFDILPETIFLMANIFAGMGSGKNTGKLTFKKICGGEGISVTEDANGITFSSTSSSPDAPQIDTFEIAFGPPISKIIGPGVTSSHFTVTDPSITNCSCRGIFGLKSIGRSSAPGYVGYYAHGSFIVGGSGNTITSSPFDDRGRRSVIIGSYNSCVPLSDNNTTTSSRDISASTLYFIGNSTIMSSATIQGRVTHGSIISSCKSTSDFISVHSDISGCCNIQCGYVSGSGGSPRMFSSISSNYSCLYMINGVMYPQCTKYNSIISSKCSNVQVCTSYGCIQYSSIISGLCSNIRSSIVSKKSDYYMTSVKNSTIVSSHRAENYSGYSTVISSDRSQIIGADNNKNTICQNNSIISSGYGLVVNSISGSIIASYLSEIDGDPSDCFRSIIGTSRSKNKGSYSSIIGGEYNTISEGKILGTIIGGFGNIILEDNSVIIGGKYNQSSTFTPSSFATYEPSKRTIQIGGYSNATNFVTIGGDNNDGYGFSIMIGGKFNKSSYSANLSGANVENHQGRSNGTVIGGISNYTTASVNSIIIGGNGNKDRNTVNSSIIGGLLNGIRALGCFNYSSYTPILQNTVRHNFIIGGQCNEFCGANTKYSSGIFDLSPYQVNFSGILGGCGNRVCATANPWKFVNDNAPGLTSSVIVAGNRICSNFNYTMSVEKLIVRGTLRTKTTGGTLCTGFSGTVTNPTSITIVNGLITDMS